MIRQYGALNVPLSRGDCNSRGIDNETVRRLSLNGVLKADRLFLLVFITPPISENQETTSCPYAAGGIIRRRGRQHSRASHYGSGGRSSFVSFSGSWPASEIPT